MHQIGYQIGIVQGFALDYVKTMILAKENKKNCKKILILC